ncbi:hypothetical protein [Crenobacter luteus]|uniref:hypothetical protein n=1 Tax=Crenobacter luteus TaxID=1452487 RepID=UPI0012E933F7|nr:hypothetical protein [Crenobacter luteus]
MSIDMKNGFYMPNANYKSLENHAAAAPIRGHAPEHAVLLTRTRRGYGMQANRSDGMRRPSGAVSPFIAFACC